MSVEHEQPVEMKIYKYVCIGARAHLEKTRNALCFYIIIMKQLHIVARMRGVMLDMRYVW